METQNKPKRKSTKSKTRNNTTLTNIAVLDTKVNALHSEFNEFKNDTKQTLLKIDTNINILTELLNQHILSDERKYNDMFTNINNTIDDKIKISNKSKANIWVETAVYGLFSLWGVIIAGLIHIYFTYLSKH